MSSKDPIGNIIIATLFILLAIAGYLSYKSIDWDVLKRMEQIPLVLPTPIPTNQQNPPSSTPSATVEK